MINGLVHLKLLSKGFKSRRISTTHAELHYYDAGPVERAPLVLLHGVGARADHFHDVLPLLVQAGHRVIALDLPWHGRSSALQRPMNPDTLFESVREALSALGTRPFTLVGNSLGGALSLRYSSENPDRVSMLVLSSPAAGFRREEDWLAMKRLLDIDTKEKCAEFLSRVFPRPPIYLPLVQHLFHEAITRPGVRELIDNTHFADFTPKPGVTAYPGRTLVLWGKNEILFPNHNLAELRNLLAPDAIVEEPAGIGHCPHFDSPKWFARRILAFVGDL